MRRTFIIALFAGFVPICSCIVAARDNVHNPRDYSSDSNVIVRDVAIIGGGSSGTHAAISLRKLGKSVVVVEKEAELGGHTRTYIDPETKTPVNYGVQSFYDMPITHSYLSDLNISTVPVPESSLTSIYADFRTGHEVYGVVSSSNYSSYLAQLDKYPYLDYGWKFPTPVPSDLLLPWKDFIHKYNLQNLAFSVHLLGQGVANILEQLAVNVFKEVEKTFVLKVSAGKGLVPASLNNHEIYDKAAARLGSDVLLSSTLLSARRSSRRDGGIDLDVKTPLGNKVVRARKLLVTIPPLIDNLRPLGLDDTEVNLFSQWTYSNYFVMLVNNTGLPDKYRFANANDTQATYNVPQLPAAYQITATNVSGLFSVWYGSPTTLTQSQVEADVADVIQRLRVTANSTFKEPPNFVEFGSHSPFKLSVSAEAIKNRFYDKLANLQGHRNTWYTGAAFLAHNSPELWNFTQSVVIPSMYS